MYLNMLTQPWGSEKRHGILLLGIKKSQLFHTVREIYWFYIL